MQRVILSFFLLTIGLVTFASPADTLHHWGVSLSGMPSKVVALDKYQRKWMKAGNNGSIALELLHTALPSDSDSFANDFGYPTLAIGLRYTMNGAVRMHRRQDPTWGLAEEVDYDSHLGNTLSLFGSFYRALHRRWHWETSYSLSGGIGFNRKWYNKYDAIDNELIGTPVLIYFGAGVYQTYHFATSWGLRAGFEFVHHSNGALYRPNKGSNSIGPSIGLVYYPYYKTLVNKRHSFQSLPFKKYWYLNVAAGMGAKTLLEDWLLTQFNTPSTEPDYRTEHFRIYPAYSLQTDVMYRYARRWASGIGIECFYGTYASHIKDLDEQRGIEEKHSPWSVGVAGKHEVFYHNLSLAMAFGFYLYRQMGENARHNESIFYEKIGVHYSFPSLHGLKVGISVKAHETKADLTEVIVTYPIKLYNVRS